MVRNTSSMVGMDYLLKYLFRAWMILNPCYWALLGLWNKLTACIQKRAVFWKSILQVYKFPPTYIPEVCVFSRGLQLHVAKPCICLSRWSIVNYIAIVYHASFLPSQWVTTTVLRCKSKDATQIKEGEISQPVILLRP